MKIKSGDIFTDWTVLTLDSVTKRFTKKWKCKCSCGNISIVNHGDLTSGKSKRCKQCGYIKVSEKICANLLEKKIGKWEILERVGTNKHRRPIWKCRCLCGTIKNVSSNNLLSGLSKSCGKCNEYEGIKGRKFSQLLGTAKARNIDVLVTKKDLWDKFEKQEHKCALSGMILILSDDKNNTASLDRIDSSKCYSVDNIQWVHKDINIMKNHFTEKYFIDMCSKIYEFKNKAPV